MKTFRLISSRHLLLAVALAIVGCKTLEYRSVQSNFEDAVRADNEHFAMPFTDAPSGYQGVAKKLTADYIAGLDPKLRPNAWTLRAVSQWRAGEFTQSVDSSLEGIAEINRLKPQVPQV